MKRLFRPAPLVLLASAGAAVIVYNLWSYCCGRCRLEHFLTIGPAGLVLIVAAALAAMTLLCLRLRRQRGRDRGHCRCGTPLSPGWLYCPVCGVESTSP
jgi:hypothetical protein